MDLIILVAWLAFIGFIIWLIENKVPMDPIFKVIIYVLVVGALVWFVIRRFGSHVPNVLP